MQFKHVALDFDGPTGTVFQIGCPGDTVAEVGCKTGNTNVTQVASAYYDPGIGEKQSDVAEQLDIVRKFVDHSWDISPKLEKPINLIISFLPQQLSVP